jgi:Ca-activated chloride channel family protein
MHIRLWTSLCILFVVAFPGQAGQRDRTDASSNAQIPGVGTGHTIPVIRSHTDLVLVPVSVRDAAGRPVAGLEIGDFRVLEDGKEVPLEHLGKPELMRLDIALVFDLTSSLWFYFDLVKEAAEGFVKTIFRPRDAVSIIGISSEPEILLKRTESLPEILEGLNGIKRFGAATAFFDAVTAATRQFSESADPETRRVLVVLSDGEDNLSSGTQEKTLEDLQRSDAIFYSINPITDSNRLNLVSMRGQKRMETLAEQTGGTAFVAESFTDLGLIYRTIAEDLQVQYLLGYISPKTKTDGSYRSITVTVPDRPELKVRARKGYYAARTEEE